MLFDLNNMQLSSPFFVIFVSAERGRREILRPVLKHCHLNYTVYYRPCKKGAGFGVFFSSQLAA